MSAVAEGLDELKALHAEQASVAQHAREDLAEHARRTSLDSIVHSWLGATPLSAWVSGLLVTAASQQYGRGLAEGDPMARKPEEES